MRPPGQQAQGPGPAKAATWLCSEAQGESKVGKGQVVEVSVCARLRHSERCSGGRSSPKRKGALFCRAPPHPVGRQGRDGACLLQLRPQPVPGRSAVVKTVQSNMRAASASSRSSRASPGLGMKLAPVRSPTAWARSGLDQRRQVLPSSRAAPAWNRSRPRSRPDTACALHAAQPSRPRSRLALAAPPSGPACRAAQKARTRPVSSEDVAEVDAPNPPGLNQVVELGEDVVDAPGAQVSAELRWSRRCSGSDTRARPSPRRGEPRHALESGPGRTGSAEVQCSPGKRGGKRRGSRGGRSGARPARPPFRECRRGTGPKRVDPRSPPLWSLLSDDDVGGQVVKGRTPRRRGGPRHDRDAGESAGGGRAPGLGSRSWSETTPR